MKWKRVHGKVEYKANGGCSFIVNWNHSFENVQDSSEEVFFAYTYPYSYAESMAKT